MAALAIQVDAFESFCTFVHQHKNWELDETFSVLLVVGLAAIVLLIRRSAQLQASPEPTKRAGQCKAATIPMAHKPTPPTKPTHLKTWAAVSCAGVTSDTTTS
jgi:hypothetical protein